MTDPIKKMLKKKFPPRAKINLVGDLVCTVRLDEQKASILIGLDKHEVRLGSHRVSDADKICDVNTDKKAVDLIVDWFDL